MKIAVIAKAEIDNPKTYTAHRNKVTYHPEDLFLSSADKSALEYALQLVEVKGGSIDAYAFEQNDVAERVLHECLALGANTATKIVAGDINDPLQQKYVAHEFAHYLEKKGEKYDVLITGSTAFSEFIAVIAQELGIGYYDHLAMIDTSLNFEMKLEKGKLLGKCVLPAAITTENTINVPRLATYTALSSAIASSINTVTFNKPADAIASEVKMATAKKERVLFDLEQDPKATTKLVAALRQNGILR
ncbi:hypothetical protein EQ500_00140 [Lactobacillus sp. XV13L]|nr:hypothetical protein [Lactobacillus sp. XV13L]